MCCSFHIFEPFAIAFTKSNLLLSNAQIILKQENFLVVLFKGYLCYKTIFCHKVALGAQLMNFLI